MELSGYNRTKCISICQEIGKLGQVEILQRQMIYAKIIYISIITKWKKICNQEKASLQKPQCDIPHADSNMLEVQIIFKKDELGHTPLRTKLILYRVRSHAHI